MQYSFVVPAHNEALYIERTVDAIHRSARATDCAYEVIVVDDASTDATAMLAAARGARVVTVRHRQIAATRNAGARVATGDVFVFVDADTEVNAAVLVAVADALRRGAAGGGSRFRFDGRLPFYGPWLQVVADVVYPRLRLASGCFLFSTRAAFVAVGGFDETRYAGEEAAMSLALRKHGEFVVVRPAVTTSGRKLRAYRGHELLLAVARTARSTGKRRDGLDVWYGERRADPDPPY